MGDKEIRCPVLTVADQALQGGWSCRIKIATIGVHMLRGADFHPDLL